jgi:hypothetical protein
MNEPELDAVGHAYNALERDIGPIGADAVYELIKAMLAVPVPPVIVPHEHRWSKPHDCGDPKCHGNGERVCLEPGCVARSRSP